MKLAGHTGDVTLVTITPDHKHIHVGQLLRGHSDVVRSVVCSADSNIIVSGLEDRTVCIWDAQTGQEVVPSPLREHTSNVLSVAISPDGSQIVSGSANGVIHVWNTKTGGLAVPPLKGHTGVEVMTMMGHKDGVWSEAISPDGLKIASGLWDRTAQIWDAKTGEEIGAPLQGHTDDVNSVIFSPNSKYIVSGSNDMTLRIWNVESGRQVQKLLWGHMGMVWSVALSSNGKFLVSSSHDNTIQVWDGELALSDEVRHV
ncbi:WD40 repeat-like protein [Coprinopsis marcescibilis]|uniref:WD40 repeat-like protein n=1 Tax=Coprinopsis marcescibilis TaxID=230819 RepID=A0A5C3KC39_COPMA|nr:WD40 repeat-like protein [Coprinopsis marcescibilis]